MSLAQPYRPPARRRLCEMVSQCLWKLAAIASQLALASQLVSAALPDGRFHGNIIRSPAIPRISNIPTGPVTSRNGTVLPPYDTTYYFDQLIDHKNPSLGTFKQRYWHTYEFYEPGRFGSSQRRDSFLIDIVILRRSYNSLDPG